MLSVIVAPSFPEIVEAGGAQFAVAHRVLDVAVPEVRLQRAGIVAVVGELVTAGMAEHVRMGFEGRPASAPARSTSLAKPAVENGPFRSVMDTNSA